MGWRKVGVAVLIFPLSFACALSTQAVGLWSMVPWASYIVLCNLVWRATVEDRP